MKMRIARLVVVTLMLTSMDLPSYASIISHDGDNDPLTELPAWTLEVDAPNTSSGPVNDSGTLAWRITDSGTALGEYRFYYYDLPSFNFSARWDLDWSVRVVSHPRHPLITEGAVVHAQVRNSSKLMIIDLVGNDPTPSKNGVWFYNSSLNFQQLYTMDTSSAYHNYRMTFDPAQNDRVSVFVDGGEVGEILLSQFPNNSDKLVGFGSGSSWDTGEANWKSVAFLPEPSSFSLLALGGLASLCARRKR